MKAPAVVVGTAIRAAALFGAYWVIYKSGKVVAVPAPTSSVSSTAAENGASSASTTYGETTPSTSEQRTAPFDQTSQQSKQLPPVGSVESIVSKTDDERFMILGIKTGQSMEEVNAALRSRDFPPLNTLPDFAGTGRCIQRTTSNPRVASLTCDTVRANMGSAKPFDDDAYAQFYEMMFANDGAGHWILASFRFSSKALKEEEGAISSLRLVLGAPGKETDDWVRWDSTRQVCVEAGCGAATFALYENDGIWIQDTALIYKLLD